jgi:hypothetical protein
MIIKAKATYNELGDGDNFNSLLSASTHLKLLAGEQVEWKSPIPKKLMEHLTEVKKSEGSKK